MMLLLIPFTSSSGKIAKAKHQEALVSLSLMSTMRLGPCPLLTRFRVGASNVSRLLAMSVSFVSGSTLRRSKI